MQFKISEVRKKRSAGKNVGERFVNIIIISVNASRFVEQIFIDSFVPDFCKFGIFRRVFAELIVKIREVDFVDIQKAIQINRQIFFT